jgi:large subunit ribosomal protein L54
MEDDEYPDWLWGLVDQGKKSTTAAAADGGDAVDLSCKLHRTLTQDLPAPNPVHTPIQTPTPSGFLTDPLTAMTKKQRQKYDRKQERLLKTLPKRTPVHEQSKDLTGPGDDAVVSLERRQEITKSSRVARRKGIRESNFLRSM